MSETFRCKLVDESVFFFKQKTAYEMRISDWSSDVCSSDLGRPAAQAGPCRQPAARPARRDPERHPRRRLFDSRQLTAIRRRFAADQRRPRKRPAHSPGISTVEAVMQQAISVIKAEHRSLAAVLHGLMTVDRKNTPLNSSH